MTYERLLINQPSNTRTTTAMLNMSRTDWLQVSDLRRPKLTLAAVTAQLFALFNTNKQVSLI